jgi:hypothetical protein
VIWWPYRCPKRLLIWNQSEYFPIFSIFMEPFKKITRGDFVSGLTGSLLNRASRRCWPAGLTGWWCHCHPPISWQPRHDECEFPLQNIRSFFPVEMRSRLSRHLLLRVPRLSHHRYIISQNIIFDLQQSICWQHGSLICLSSCFLFFLTTSSQ